MAIHQLGGRRRHDDVVHLGKRLDPRREIDGLSHGQPIMRSSGTDITDDRDSGVNPHADVKLRLQALADPLIGELHAFDDAQRGAHRANGVVFMSHRVAEVRHHPIPEELRDVAFVAPESRPDRRADSS